MDKAQMMVSSDLKGVLGYRFSVLREMHVRDVCMAERQAFRGNGASMPV